MADDFHKHVLKTKKIINDISPSYCMSKWYQLSVHLHTGTGHSCYHPPVHKIPLEEIKNNPGALHNTNHKKQQRKMMLDGIRPPECQYCWDIEDLPGEQISDRYLRSSEKWAYGDIDKIKNTPWDEDVYPRYLELSFGNMCQFKCTYCAPSASSSIFNETKKLGNWPLKNPKNVGQYDIGSFLRPGEIYTKEDENPYIDAFWKWFPDAYKHLHVLRFTGGEPLMSTNVYKVMDYISENPNEKLEFSMNTNMGVPDRNYNKFLKAATDLVDNNKIGDLLLYTSIDTWGKQAEWIRTGLDVDVFERNIKKYLNGIPNSKISIMITFCAMSIPKFNLLLEKILELRKEFNTDGEQRVFFDTPYMLEPPHLVATILTDDWVEYLQKHLKFIKDNLNDGDINKFSTTEYRKLERVYEWIKANKQTGVELNLNRGDFYRFVIENDKRRDKNFLEAFPEMEDFLYLCKKAANE